jgi:hypothetical protein
MEANFLLMTKNVEEAASMIEIARALNNGKKEKEKEKEI